MTRAIKTQQMSFLYCVYAFNKNYEKNNKEGSSVDEDTDGQDSKNEDTNQYRVFTFNYLIEKILTFCDEEAQQRVKEVA